MVNIASCNSITEKPIVSLRETPSFITTNSQFATDTLMSLFHRVLILITFMVMSVGSVWGQTWQNGTAYSGTVLPAKYAKYSDDSFTFNFSSEIQSALSGLDITKIYVRWDIYNTSTGEYIAFDQYGSTLPWIGCSNYNYALGNSNKFKFYYKSADWHSFDLDATLNATLSRRTTSFENCILECFVTDEYTKDDSHLPAGNTPTVVEEPAFKLKIEVIFNATGKKPDTFKGSLKSSGQTLTGGAAVGQADVLATSATFATLDLAAALGQVSGTAKYARIFLMKDGDAVDPTGKLTVTGGTAGPEKEHGFYISKPAGITASDLSGVTLELTAGEYEDYQVVCVFSTDEATTLPTKEPNWDLQYTYLFEYPFKGDASSATKVEKTFKLPASTWTTSPKEFSIDFDFAGSKILLKDKDNSATLTSVDMTESFWDSYTSATLGGSDNFYIRWFLKNKSTGVETYIPNSIRNINGASTLKNCAKAQYGRFWSKKIGDSQTDLNNIMRVKIDGTPDSPGTTFNITDYDLVCTIGTGGDEVLDGSSQVTMEPATLQMQYTFHFENRGFPATNIATVTTINKNILYDGVLKIGQYGNEAYKNVASDMGVASDGLGNLYTRWYVTDLAGNIVSDLTDWNFSATKSYTKNDDYGHYILGFESWNATQYDPTFDYPSTYTAIQKDYTKYKFVCVLTLDRTGMEPSTAPLTNEPTSMQLKYVYSFLSPEDYYANFPADNITTVKTIYKNALYTKTDDGGGNTIGGTITPSLFANISEVMTDLGVSKTKLKSDGYARWYVTDALGNILSDLTDWGFTASKTYTKNPAYGHYIHLNDLPDYGDAPAYDPTFTLPSTGYVYDNDYKNLRVVCVLTTDLTGENLPDEEATTMQVKYVFNLILTETEFAALPFVHYKGQSGRDWMTPDGSTGSQTQKIWNSSTGEAEDFTGDIRQGVHTWEYDVYINPGETRPIILPFENYTSGGNNLEPRGYIRWYDWKTDTKVVDKTTDSSKKFTFTKNGTELNDANRGLFGLCLSASPTHGTVGVSFTPDADFSETIDIACDVSKYSDGITTVGGNSYLIHEPTLSNRYIFHIHPASEGAAMLAASKTTLDTGESNIKAGADNAAMHDLFVANENTMFKLAEDKGKVVVSLGASKAGSFALRFDEHSLLNYILPNGGGYVSADRVQWYAYFENADGIWKKKIGNTETNRITTFTYINFTSDTYTNLKGEGSLSITDGKKFHVVGYAGNGDFNVMTGTGNYAPVVHYELHFIEAPAIPVSNLSDVANLERTDEYLNYHYDLAGVVDFDGNPDTNANISGHEAEYYSTTNWSDAPTSSANNMTWTPFPWDDIQYGFSYPPLTSTIKNGYAGDLWVSPEHGDYIILKSMNVSGVSSEMNTPPYNYHWWDSSELYDYTHTVTDNSKYGSFLYTDASNESRTIATIPFTADLCHGSSIYFTAAVADMTSGTIKPQLLIRIVGIDGSGNRHNVVAFHTCDILTTGATSGVWNQVYGASTIPTTFDDNITNFVAEVINYANDTNGADFALDQLVVYTSTSKVNLKQTGSTCENPTDGKLKIYMDAEGLQNVYGKSDTEQTIYWRICREEDGTVVTAPGMYPQYDGLGNKLTDDGTFTYGVSKVKSNFNPALDPTGDVKTEVNRESDAYGWYISADNTIYFQIANQNFPGLEEGGRYYVSVFDPNEAFDNSKNSYWGGLHWGATSKCSIFSNFFIPQRQYVTYSDGAGGTEGGDLMISCGSAASVSGIQMILKVPDVVEATGFKSFTDLHYDYVFVPLDTWNSTTATFSHGSNDYKYEDLKTALADYRGVSSSYKAEVGLASGYASVNATNYNLLSYAIAEGIMDLAYSTTFTHTFTGSDYTVSCLPVEQSVTISSGSTGVCSPFEVTFSLKGSSPELELGFSDVVYPTAYTKRVVRIGLEQLTNLRTGGYKLHVPIRLFKDKDKKTDNTLSFTSEYLTLSATSTDPTNPTTGTNFAKIVNPTDASLAPVVDADHMYLTLDLSGTNCAIDFHEGFEYEVSTSYYDTRDASVVGRCEGDVYLIIKVVPEFVTWHPQAIDATYYNVNWNNDENWQRSTRAELYKDENVAGKKQNTATAGHPSGFDNNGENTLTAITSTPNTYVPMKFSYVTLPEGCRAPSLINMNITAYPGSDYTGGILLAGDLGTDRSPADGTSVATENIKYDMLVRYSYDSSDKQNECQGHYKVDGVTVVGKGDANIYDCEKFYGNICREVYFKPGAEMINQQRLTYKKAWVEKELDRNKWYMLSAPLKGTYAGDAYVPASAITDYSLATPATVIGKQVTEAFQPISFNTTTYSRTNYPIYQRSWDHSENGGKVYTETTDPRATQYTANLKFSGAVSSTFAQWSHVYNDMEVKYDDLQGFALRAHKKDGDVGEKVMLRWPKADVSYTYYDYKDDSGSVTATTAKGSAVYGRFVTDGYDNKATMELSLDEANVNADDQYYLVGNPYMASIDMAKFFVKNTSLVDGKYWKIDGNPSTGLTTGQVKPMESFFVKTTDPTVKINFDNSMMVDGNAPVLSPAPAMTDAPVLMLTAQNDRGTSKASVVMGEGQSVETLFDSNLEDVPMVYTVADGQAVSINHAAQLEAVSFGVTCKSDEAVDVTLTGLDAVVGGLYVFDAVDGTTTAVGEGSTVSVMPNEYGRYFLTLSTSLGEVKEGLTEGVKVSVHGGVISIAASADLGTVRALSIGGSTLFHASDCGASVQFRLQQGIYVIETDGPAGNRTMKVVVK